MWSTGAWADDAAWADGAWSEPSPDFDVLTPSDRLERQIEDDRAFFALAAVAAQHAGTDGMADDLAPFYESPLDMDKDLL